ncbi:hypothetical protein EVC10_042 [Rhizobium phage RHph_Y25]|nr:hypothetical protein EVC10_042 [Rhizobium phage RHph_Y25]
MPNTHSRHGTNAMTVGANNFAFGYLPFCLRNALCVADVQLLASANVVELQGCRVRTISAVKTAALKAHSWACRREQSAEAGHKSAV